MNLSPYHPRVLHFLKFFISALLIFIFFNSNAQVRVPFQERASQNNPSRKTFDIKGDFALIGNTNLTLENYSDDLMNDNMLIYVDVDSDPTTINSSSATLIFSNENGADSNCSQVLFAGLYWSGRGPIDDEFEVTTADFTNKKLNRRQVTLKGPDGNSQLFTAKQNDIRYTYGLDLPNDLGLFVGFVEVTDFVKNNGQGEYTVSDLAALEGTNYHYGGWSMVVIYENPSMTNRSITVFDGYAFVRGSVLADYTIPISGFATVDSGPVRMKLGVAAGEGDVGATGDYFEIEKTEGAGDFVRLSHSGNTNNNFFNSSISTGGNPRNPQLKNNTGMDISVFEIPNVNNEILKNGQTSARFRYGTDGDAYVIYNIITAVETNKPLVEGYHFLKPDQDGNLPDIKPLDEIELVVEIRNRGQLPIDNASLEVNLPGGLEYISGETEYFFTNPTGISPEFANGVLHWDIGDLPVPNSEDVILAKITYKVKVTGECDILLQTCGSSFVVDGNITGTNSVTGSPMSTAALKIGENEGGTCLDSPIFGPIEMSISSKDYLLQECGYDEANSLITICEVESSSMVEISELTEFFPTGTRFFENFPITETTIEFTDALPFDKDQTYFAILPNNPNCSKEFSLQSGYFEVEVEIEEASCESGSSQRLVTFTVMDQVMPLSFDYQDGKGFVQESSRQFPIGKHQVIVQNFLGCQREVEFEILPLQNFSLDIQKIGEDESCQEFSNFSLAISIGSNNVDDTFDLTIEGITQEGQPYSFTKLDLAIGLFEFKEIGAGSYVVQVENTNGCNQTSELIIENEDVAFLDVEFGWKSSSTLQSGSVQPGEIILFDNLSNGSGQLAYTWNFGDGEGSSEFSPEHSYNRPGTYEVVLTVNSSDNCLKEFKNTIEVGRPALRVPDAFTPNNDGRNDYFFPVFSQIEGLRFWVFNRWGEALYYSDSLTDQGWNGTIKGVDAPAGTYIYRVEYWTGATESTELTGSFILIK